MKELFLCFLNLVLFCQVSLRTLVLYSGRDKNLTRWQFIWGFVRSHMFLATLSVVYVLSFAFTLSEALKGNYLPPFADAASYGRAEMIISGAGWLAFVFFYIPFEFISRMILPFLGSFFL